MPAASTGRSALPPEHRGHRPLARIPHPSTETHTMRTHKTLPILGALLTASAIAPPPLPASARAPGPTPDYKPVTAARLANPEPENWLLTKGNYAGWSYTPLEQITPANV